MATIAELFDQALRQQQSGNLAQAELLYRQILRAEPGHAWARNNLGVALKNQGRPADAIEQFQHVLRLNPNHAGASNNLGTALFNQGKFEDALAAYRHCLRLQPDFTEAHNNMGSALLSLGHLQEAIAGFQKALQLKPNYAEAHANLGNALGQQGKLSEADECFRQALAIDPGHATARWNRALLRLLQGDFAGGWRDFHYREALPGMVPPYSQQPRWDGSPLEGKTLLVYAEQAENGLGDTLQFLRYLSLLRQRGGSVVLKCQAYLVNLLAGCAGIDRLVPFGATLPAFDVQIPLLHLPAVFGTTLANLPAEIPYLHADTKLVERYQEILRRAARRKPAGEVSESEKPFKIGIVWQGSMNQIGDRRSLPLAHFAALARLEGIRLVSFQVGPGREQLKTVTFPVIDLGGRFDPSSLDDLAAALMNVDLVITVDTAVAHLAGALGVPVWTLLQFAPDWRWLLDRADCPWYPTMRLFRQKNLGDWDNVFECVAHEIIKFSPGSQNRLFRK